MNAAMGPLAYGVDRRLRNGDDLLADFGDGGTYGCVVVAGAEYEIEHRGRTAFGCWILVERESVPMPTGGGG